MKRYFRDETGMYTDWDQLEKLPEIDTLIDIGVGPMGTPEMYNRFPDANLILIDPLDETEKYIDDHLQARNVSFFKCALGEEQGESVIHVEREIGNSSILNVASINFESDLLEKRTVQIRTLDSVISTQDHMGKVGIKIDTEGFELNIVKGARKTLESTEFVLAEVRHNHESFEGVYKLHDFVGEMQDNGFILTMILTAKPFIADLCFQKRKSL